MRLLRAFHNLRQHPAHVFRMEEEYRRSMRPDAGGPEDPESLAFVEGPRRFNIRHLEAKMVLPALGIPLEELTMGESAPSGSISSIWLLGVSTKHTRTPCAGRSNGSRTTSAPIRSRYMATDCSMEAVATPTWFKRPSFTL